MANIGYARVSSTGQSLEIQLQQLTEFGCVGGDNKIFSEKLSGTNSNRPQLKACLNHLRENDNLIISRLDRLARSTHELTNIAADLEKRGINLKVLNQNIDTSTSTGKLLFNLLASISEFETQIRKERQSEGIINAKNKGVKFGAKAKLSSKQLQELKEKRASGTLIKNLMSEYQLSKASVYRLLDRQDL